MRAERGPLRGSAEHGFAFSKRSAEHGFTLIEIMVALAVFSLAAMALIRLESATIRGAAIVDDTQLGTLVARNIAIEAVSDADTPMPGQSSGVETNGGRAWRWTRSVTPTGGAGIVRIDVAVRNGGGSIVGRQTMVRGPSPATPQGSVSAVAGIAQ